MPSGSQAQAEVQRLRDQIAQMQASTVEQIAEVQRKYEELQQQLITDAATREAAAAARKVEEAVMAAVQSRKKGWILVKKHYCKSVKIIGVFQKDAAKGHDL
ncbi:hypothetical protein J1N35_010410 [Gossypium stocksii]|uniref:Uncharacterized protein n=1 Tax=Gossypium stocksii TaxID=47602 RepID=A0A9D3W0X8_9ROSI|nr:hypothetical protein J1N35_010410 [Gossypium stocksii]